MNDRDYEKEIENLNKDATRLLELHKKTIKEKEELQNRINKAIEYIKDKYYDRFLEDGLEEWLNDNGLNDRKQIMCILEILKGENEK